MVLASGCCPERTRFETNHQNILGCAAHQWKKKQSRFIQCLGAIEPASYIFRQTSLTVYSQKRHMWTLWHCRWMTQHVQREAWERSLAAYTPHAWDVSAVSICWSLLCYHINVDIHHMMGSAASFSSSGHAAHKPLYSRSCISPRIIKWMQLQTKLHCSNPYGPSHLWYHQIFPPFCLAQRYSALSTEKKGAPQEWKKRSNGAADFQALQNVAQACSLRAVFWNLGQITTDSFSLILAWRDTKSKY